MSCGAALPVFKITVVDHIITFPVTLFIDSDLQLVDPKHLLNNIGLKKEKDGSCLALLFRCTHADNQLIPIGDAFKCTLYGSAFDNDGHVTNGPAERP